MRRLLGQHFIGQNEHGNLLRKKVGDRFEILDLPTWRISGFVGHAIRLKRRINLFAKKRKEKKSVGLLLFTIHLIILNCSGIIKRIVGKSL